MALDLSKIKRTLNLTQLKLVIYGEEKVGKSTFCSQMPEPVFIDIEEGTNFLNINRINKEALSIEEWTYSAFLSVLNDLLTQEHEFKTLVIDSVDWLEGLVQTHIKAENKAKSYLDSSIKALAYGGGTAFLQQYMKDVFDLLDEIRHKKKMHIVLIAHTKKKNETDVQGASFDKSVLKLTEKSEGLCIEWADFILFAKNKPYTVTEDEGFTNRTRAVDGGRIIYTAKNPAFSGGGRLLLPEELPLQWEAFSGALRAAIADMKALSAPTDAAKDAAKKEEPKTKPTTTKIEE